LSHIFKSGSNAKIVICVFMLKDIEQKKKVVIYIYIYTYPVQ